MKINYLNNKDILKEIHKSKNNYSSYCTAEDHAFDFIVNDPSKMVDPQVITAAIAARADRLTKELMDTAKAAGAPIKLETVLIDPSTITAQEVVFRSMTWDHIPWVSEEAEALADDELTQDELDANSLRTDEEVIVQGLKDSKAAHVKVNFPPFQHFRLDHSLLPVCIGKSHWSGDIDTGVYCRDHGQMTNKLAHMFMKLCERYATRSNWRNYTYNDEMRSQALLQLSQIGLQFDESKSQNPFAYYTAVITNSFTRVLNVEKGHQNIRDDILEINGMNPSYTRQGQSSSGYTGIEGGGSYEN
jgi:hypothetical protein